MSPGASAPDPFVDFYAGVIAATAVVLFAKFVTHSRHCPRSCGWWAVHWLCAGTAWFALVVSLVELSKLFPLFLADSPGQEATIRAWVLWTAVIASTIFAADVAWAGHSRTTPTEIEAGQPPADAGSQERSPS